jgi:hypothetical protein
MERSSVTKGSVVECSVAGELFDDQTGTDSRQSVLDHATANRNGARILAATLSATGAAPSTPVAYLPSRVTVAAYLASGVTVAALPASTMPWP